MKKQPKIYIGNQFYNESELLWLKLNEINLQLSKYNIEFSMVLVENDHTFTGNPKPYLFDELKETEKFLPFKDNIIHIKMNGFKDSELNSENAMKNDFIQKRKIAEGFNYAEPEDICVLTDLDEIPDFRSIFKFFNNDLNNIDKIYTLQIKLFYYYYNCKAMFEDDRVTIFKRKHFRGVDEHRAGEVMGVPRIWIPNSGWHFSYLGGTEFVKNKVSNFGHSELNTPEVQANIEKNIKSLSDIYGRGVSYKVVPLDDSYPEFFLNNLSKFKHNLYNDLRS